MNTFELKDQTVFSDSREATEMLGEALARALRPGCVVALYGNLGAGKTVFARGFARGLGITDAVSSPTYTIVQEYPLPKENGGYFYHLDLYRIADEHAALGFGADEFLDDPASYALLEWPERIQGILPPGRIAVTIRRLSENEREIELKFPQVTDK